MRGKFIHLGTHSTKEAAAEAYAEAAAHYQGEFAPDFIKQLAIKARRKRDTVNVSMGTVDIYVLTQALKRASEAGLLETVCHESCSDRILELLAEAKRKLPT